MIGLAKPQKPFLKIHFLFSCSVASLGLRPSPGPMSGLLAHTCVFFYLQVLVSMGQEGGQTFNGYQGSTAAIFLDNKNVRVIVFKQWHWNIVVPVNIWGPGKNSFSTILTLSPHENDGVVLFLLKLFFNLAYIFFCSFRI